jgi:hypothetical protein
MSDDSNIISLSDRARLRKGGRTAEKGARKPGAGEPTVPSGPRAQAPDAAPGSTAPPASSGSAAPASPAASVPLPTQLIWLFCPACETLEYTELVLPNGRVHQSCGTQVEEVTVPVDARAEYSLAELNLRQLERLAELVEGQRARFREYQHRLELAAGQPLSSYPLTEDTVRVMPVAEVDPLGLFISVFLRQPLQRFRPEAQAADGAATPDAGTPPGAPAPGQPAPGGGDKPQR